MSGKSSRERGYYGPSPTDLTIGALTFVAIILAVVAFVAFCTCSA